MWLSQCVVALRVLVGSDEMIDCILLRNYAYVYRRPPFQHPSMPFIYLKWESDAASRDGLKYDVVPLQEIQGTVHVIPDFDSAQERFFLNTLVEFLFEE